MKSRADEYLFRNTVGGIFGNILEWYDFAVYEFLAPIMGTLFFPAGYLMRPLGGILFGHIGDKFGRKKALQLSIVMMAVPTVLVGVLPTLSLIGLYTLKTGKNRQLLPVYRGE